VNLQIVCNSHLLHLCSSLISPCKHGFVKRRSTTTNLFELTSFVIHGFNKKQTLYTDISKAKLLLNPNILWQCDSCVVTNDSHSKIDEFDYKLKALERLYQGLHNKFLEAFLPKDDVLTQNLSSITFTILSSKTISGRTQLRLKNLFIENRPLW